MNLMSQNGSTIHFIHHSFLYGKYPPNSLGDWSFSQEHSKKVLSWESKKLSFACRPPYNVLINYGMERSDRGASPARGEAAAPPAGAPREGPRRDIDDVIN